MSDQKVYWQKLKEAAGSGYPDLLCNLLQCGILTLIENDWFEGDNREAAMSYFSQESELLDIYHQLAKFYPDYERKMDWLSRIRDMSGVMEKAGPGINEKTFDAIITVFMVDHDWMVNWGLYRKEARKHIYVPSVDSAVTELCFSGIAEIFAHMAEGIPCRMFNKTSWVFEIGVRSINCHIDALRTSVERLLNLVNKLDDEAPLEIRLSPVALYLEEYGVDIKKHKEFSLELFDLLADRTREYVFGKQN